MSVYTDWQADFLAVAKLPNTKHNRDFLSAWHAHAESNCKLNPIDLTQRFRGTGSGADHSEDCKPANVPYHPNAHYQSYDDRVWTRTAFSVQIKEWRFRHIKAALASGNPYTYADWKNVVEDIGNWGSQTYANVYLNARQGVGGPAPGSTTPKGHHGYHSFQKALARNLPTKLRRSKIIRHRVLHKLGLPHKVH